MASVLMASAWASAPLERVGGRASCWHAGTRRQVLDERSGVGYLSRCASLCVQKILWMAPQAEPKFQKCLAIAASTASRAAGSASTSLTVTGRPSSRSAEGRERVGGDLRGRVRRRARRARADERTRHRHGPVAARTFDEREDRRRVARRELLSPAVARRVRPKRRRRVDQKSRSGRAAQTARTAPPRRSRSARRRRSSASPRAPRAVPCQRACA